MYSLQALSSLRIYVHVLFSVRAVCHLHIELSVLVLLCMQEHTVGSQCIVSFCFILILLQPLILALIVKRNESGQKGQPIFKPNEKSKEDTVYAQGCDFSPSFSERRRIICSNLIATLKTSAAPFQRALKNPQLLFLFEYGLDLLSGLLGLC